MLASFFQLVGSESVRVSDGDKDVFTAETDQVNSS